ncbi:MAG TPA: DUF4185 domain-containing protein [Xanthobacteraceae bacterium]|nr:DUF4185 domain-containing protein [Xanthobacteraceae bacterium]
MSMSRARAFVAALIIVTTESFAVSVDAATLSLVGSSTKVCQLIGDADWATHQPTAAQTLSNFGLDAVDLGFPVDGGAAGLFFLFGDAVPNGHPPNSPPSLPPDDALGFTMRTMTPDSATCLDLQLTVSAPKTFAHPTVLPAIQQGSFNVPTGGLFLNNTLYAFFWTDHCVFAQTLTPDPGAPLTFPPPNLLCPESLESNSVGHSVLAKATPADPVGFSWAIPPDRVPLLHMPSGFVYVSAAKPPPGPNPPPLGIPIFGAARYRASIPYLAVAPSATFDDPDTWSFFAGSLGGNPVWITRQQWESGHTVSGEWAPPSGAEIYDAVPPSERCVGEHSVTWNAPLHVWLLLYNCEPWTVEARFAPDPWGPWSPPIPILSLVQNPGAICTLIMSDTGCPGLVRRNYWTLPNGKPWPGIFYAPFVLDRFTQDATLPGPGQPKRATIYWLLSTWNPYTIVVMQSTLALQ